MATTQIKIGKEEYKLIDEIGNVAVVDSFVKLNKLLPPKTGKVPGHGEARLYVGPQTEDKFIDSFFDNYTHAINCFFLKTDMLVYLNDAKYEYQNQEQKYFQDISGFWKSNYEEVEALGEEKQFFEIESANGAEDETRYYIRSLNSRSDVPWVLFRTIALPRITYVSILKIESGKGDVFYYFKLFIDYEYNAINHPAKIKSVEREIEKSGLSKVKKENIYQARKGQGKFRSGLLNQMQVCPFTQVTDERILIASHIKPWSVSNDNEKVDPYNGIIFTPTYDKLFDEGFISFNDDGEILISPYISPLNRKRLNLSPGKLIDIKPAGREKYLKHHRAEVFKK